MSPTHADSWPAAALAGTVLIVLLKAWHGWKIGVVRQAVGLIALVGAVAVGTFGGALVAPLLAGVPQVPAAARGSLGGLALGVLIYLAITLVSAVIFKKTEHQSVGVIRLGYGLAGAFLGAVMGLIFAAALALGFLAATGRHDVLEHLQQLDFQKALDATALKPEPPPTRPHRTSPR